MNDRVQHFFAAFQDEARALVQQKILNSSDAGGLISAFARIAADAEARRPEVGATEQFQVVIGYLAAKISLLTGREIPHIIAEATERCWSTPSPQRLVE